MINWEKIDNKTILLTGATGLVGKTFIEFILNRNNEHNLHTKIIAVGRKKEKFNQRFCDIKLTEDISFIEHNVNQPIHVDNHLDYIIHMASNTHPRLYATEPIDTELTNIFGTKNLLDLAAENKNCVFFFMSSGDVYGENTTGKGFLTEKDFGYVDCNTLRAGYIEGKRASEALLNAYYEEKGIPFHIGRLCRVFGANMQLDESKAVSQFIMNAARGQDIILKSEGNQVFSYLHCDDVVFAMLYIICNGEYGNAYNIADNNLTMTLKELAQTMADISGVKVVRAESDSIESKGASGFQNVCLDSTKINQLGWRPSLTIKEGLTKTIKELKNRHI